LAHKAGWRQEKRDDFAKSSASGHYRALELAVIDERIDWISASARPGTRSLGLEGFARRLVADESAFGNKMEGWGTSGFVGQTSGSWRWGTGPQGTIVQVGGEQAQLWALALADLADHMSRVDYCVTALDPCGTIHPDEEYWRDWIAGGGAMHGRTQAERRQKDDGGAVFYAGSRASAIYRRCYDKGKEAPDRYPAGAWRWEVELKSYASEREHARITSGQTHKNHPRRMVAASFAAVGLGVPFATESSSMPKSPGRPPSDADRSLDWLTLSVGPTVAWLRSIGRLDSTLAALRLPELIQ